MHGGTCAHAGKRENREELRRRKSAGCGEREGVRDGVRGGRRAKEGVARDNGRETANRGGEEREEGRARNGGRVQRVSGKGTKGRRAGGEDDGKAGRQRKGGTAEEKERKGGRGTAFAAGALLKAESFRAEILRAYLLKFFAPCGIIILW